MHEGPTENCLGELGSLYKHYYYYYYYYYYYCLILGNFKFLFQFLVSLEWTALNLKTYSAM